MFQVSLGSQSRKKKKKKNSNNRFFFNRRLYPLHSHDGPAKKGPAWLEGQEREGDAINNRIRKERKRW